MIKHKEYKKGKKMKFRGKSVFKDLWEDLLHITSEDTLEKLREEFNINEIKNQEGN
ncbi:MAG: hypothetical protein GF317_16040 [Candidatus Lokiarchaeota archaeon]|nr:hypothetical protein [Candidatus Lokiarchaeota archaeon]